MSTVVSHSLPEPSPIVVMETVSVQHPSYSTTDAQPSGVTVASTITENAATDVCVDIPAGGADTPPEPVVDVASTQPAPAVPDIPIDQTIPTQDHFQSSDVVVPDTTVALSPVPRDTEPLVPVSAQLESALQVDATSDDGTCVHVLCFGCVGVFALRC